MTVGGLSALGRVGRPSQRALAKQRTREKILAAAKALFAERCYEGATVRDIAGAAGMSTGAVFASFTDKSDLFGEIVGAEQERLVREMRDASQGLRGRPAVEAILDAAARRHMAELPLLNATMSVLWSQDLGRLMCKRLGRPPAIELIGAVLKDAAALGAPMADADPELLAEMLWGVYMAALRRTIRENLDLEALRGLVRDQVEVLLTGATRN